MSLADDFSISDPVPFLREYNAWRRGGDGPQPDPILIGSAIDVACDEVERLSIMCRLMRATLEQIATGPRKTREWRNASATLKFIDMQLADKC